MIDNKYTSHYKIEINLLHYQSNSYEWNKQKQKKQQKPTYKTKVTAVFLSSCNVNDVYHVNSYHNDVTPGLRFIKELKTKSYISQVTWNALL